MAVNITLEKGDIAIQPFFESVQQALGAAEANFRLQRGATGTTVVLPAGAGNDMVALAVEGHLRYRTTPLEVAVGGGGAGTYVVWATAHANDFTGPADDIDLTNYDFDIAIRPDSGGPPAGPGIDHVRQVATLQWDGAAITGLDLLIGPASGTGRHAARHAVGGDDVLTPAAIGAATQAALDAEVAARQGAGYVVTDDPRLANARVPIAHAASHARGAADAIPGIVPIGGMLPWAGDGDPAGGDFLLADGRLLDRATPAGAAVFAVAQHKYNGGVDPGNNKVRIPDKRGRASVGADTMRTGADAYGNPATGAAGRLTTAAGHSNAPGQNGGAETHGLGVTEMPPHTHFRGYMGPVEQGLPGSACIRMWYDTTGTSLQTNSTGGSSGAVVPHNNAQPYEVDNWIVRVL